MMGGSRRGDARWSGWSVVGLTVGERAILLALRRWDRFGTTHGMAAIRHALEQARLPPDALLPLFTLFGALAADRTQFANIHEPFCPDVGLDEARLLDAMAAAQAGLDDVAMGLLERWLPLVALCMAVGAARDLGAALARAGVWLPGGRSGAALGLTPMVAAE